MGQVEHCLQTNVIPKNTPENGHLAPKLFKMHTLRVAQLDLMVTILNLSRFIQRHRGATLALLGGDNSFRTQVETLQKQTSAQFEYLQCLNQSADNPLTESDYEQLNLGWLTIIKDWENDELHHSFEFHSHLLELIIRISRQLSERVLATPEGLENNEPLRSRVDNSFTYPLHSLTQTCVIDLYELVEYLARIRGLGTHMAVIGHTDKELGSKVSFWLQEFRYRKERFDQNIQLVSSQYLPCIPGLKSLPNLNMKLNYFISLLGHEMVSERNFKVPSHKLFLMGTEIIDGHLAVMDQANAVVRDQLYEMNQMMLERLSMDAN
ncbi:hypothetical protein Kalk_19130 [Ketobacter alkanivorans]|uniref:Uncharacterized protein n=1 Tax=Ketobacter alkanivorans TaxID=1917421 RepID=A0A2K9LQA3_9GAMM|nr:hypothetical protein Kalk_19130 [Ketobacter alkanivorans]